MAADSGGSETHAWVASKTVDGDWLRARVTEQVDGQATLVTLETNETHTVPSDVSCWHREDGMLDYSPSTPMLSRMTFSCTHAHA